jgi:hypothetical protein
MPRLLNNPAHWRLRAQEARLLASHLEVAKAATLKIAEEYDRLATRAATRDRDEAAKPNGQGRDSAAVEPWVDMTSIASLTRARPAALGDLPALRLVRPGD